MRDVTYSRAVIPVVFALVLCSLTWHEHLFKVKASGDGEPKKNNNDDDEVENVCDNVDTDEFFPSFPGGKVPYLGPDTMEPFAFRYYNESEVVLGKPMKEWLTFSVAFWHSIRGDGSDPFGAPTKRWPWDDDTCGNGDSNGGDSSRSSDMRIARRRMRAMFELMRKLGIDRWCFHDRDIAPLGKDLAETNANLDDIVEFALSLQRGTGIKPLWGTAQLFSEPHYMSGAATSPHVDVFVRAAAQVKKAMEATHRLGGENFNFWGGREGYSYLPTTDLPLERSHAARFFQMAARYWRDVLGATGPLLIEPKPQEPSKHQYDWDVAATAGFLREFGLHEKFRLNVECNHATLAGHSCAHETETAVAMGMLGGLDANTGDPQVGWDTDQFMTDAREAAQVLLPIVRGGGANRGAGLAPGGINFDAKLRRESVDVEDLLHGHIGGMDAMARGLKAAVALADPDGPMERLRSGRYASWRSDIGRRIEAGVATLEELEAMALDPRTTTTTITTSRARNHHQANNLGAPLRATSGKQEAAENILARVVH